MMSGDLYHALGEWTPKVMGAGGSITPGCIEHVHFSPKTVLKTLKGKPEGWLINTISERAPGLSYKV